MPDQAVYLLLVEGFADWEPAHAVAELRRHGNYRVEAVGLTLAPVRSMGGISVLPSKVVSEVDPEDVEPLLPEGDGEVERRRRLRDAALLVRERDDLRHHLLTGGEGRCRRGDRAQTRLGVRGRLEGLLDVPVEKAYEPEREADVRASWADLASAHRLLGYETQVELEDGLRRTMDFLLDRKEHR